jgi:ComF family protein
VKRALHALKYAGERRVAVPLGAAIAARWAEAGAGGDLLVPVPIHPERLRVRGYDQAVLLADAAAALLPLPAVVALARARATRPQFELGRERRAENVAGAFRIRDAARGAVAGRWVVLVDDVATTGATLVSCACTLLESGAAGVSACTVAREA